MKRNVLTALLAILAFPACSLAANYSILDLGIPGRDAFTASINDAGQTLLVFYPLAISDPPLSLFNDGQHTDDLTSLLLHASFVNNLGQVLDTVPTGTGTALLRLVQNGTTQDLFAFGDDTVRISRLNDSGTYIANTQDVSGSDAFVGTLSSSQIMTIPSLGGDVTGAFGLNNLAQVVGTSRTGKSFAGDEVYQEAFLYDHGVMRGLGTLGGGSSTADAINDHSVIVGESAVPNNGPDHAFVYDAVHGMRDVDMRDTSAQRLNSVATDINNSGTIIGSAERSYGNRRAALFDETTGVHFLDDLIPPNSGWDFLYLATDINNRGQIVGTGVIHGESHAFLITPTPEPSSLALALLAAVAILVLTRDRCRYRNAAS